MVRAKPKFVVSPHGRKEAVLLRVAEYRHLLERIEDLEDAIALDRAEKTSKRLIPYAKVRTRLQRAGKL
jgi:PHD/YefM family antitoxin component YafN of YafNO toxin-antitoxin module